MSERLPMIAGNWKMHKTRADGVALAEAVSCAAAEAEGVEVMIAPPFTALSEVGRAISAGPVMLGAQNIHPAEQGAFTGEISAAMLKDVGVSYVLTGHSERRHIMGESDAFIREKTAAALAAGLRPVLCIGETLEQRQTGQTSGVLTGQLEAGLAGLEPDDGQALVIAYEPVWAIGTGQTASPETAQQAHALIRSRLAARYGNGLAKQIRILYGGSVNGGNVKDLMARPDIDGALVGGASLTAEDFSVIVRFRD